MPRLASGRNAVSGSKAPNRASVGIGHRHAQSVQHVDDPYEGQSPNHFAACAYWR